MRYFRKPDNDKLSPGTAYWIKYIKNRIANNKNFLGCFIGQTGSGKSWSAISLKELLDEGEFDTSFIFFKSTDFLKTLVEKDLPKGTVLIWDEAGKDLNAKQWQAKANRVVNIVMQVFRRENLIILFTLPYFSFLDSDARKLVHATFETQTIDRDKKEAVVKPLLIQVNQDTGKMYKKFLRVSDEEKGVVPVKRIRLPMPNPEIVKEYEDVKEAFAKETYREALNDLLALETKKKNGKELTEKQKQAYDLHKEGKTQKEIAEIMNTTARNVGHILAAAKKKLNVSN